MAVILLAVLKCVAQFEVIKVVSNFVSTCSALCAIFLTRGGKMFTNVMFLWKCVEICLVDWSSKAWLKISQCSIFPTCGHLTTWFCYIVCIAQLLWEEDVIKVEEIELISPSEWTFVDRPCRTCFLLLALLSINMKVSPCILFFDSLSLTIKVNDVMK